MRLKSKSLVLLCGVPDKESQLMERPLAGPEGDYLAKLLGKAGLSDGDIHITYCRKEPNESLNRVALLQELNELQPRVVWAMGSESTYFFLKTTVKKVAGRFIGFDGITSAPVIVPWYAPSRIYLGGKKLTKDTISLLTKIKDYLCCQH